jgi:hypothetical protein
MTSTWNVTDKTTGKLIATIEYPGQRSSSAKVVASRRLGVPYGSIKVARVA